jgi:ubiquinone/menaquinone biosynthesis C-methylase UbiE
MIMVRATHHFEKMDKVMQELHRILKPGGVLVIEVANKKTLPRMFRYWFKKSNVNPFDKNPSNLKEISKDGFYNYHPKWIEELFEKTGFEIKDILSVSNFRSARMKKMFKAKTLIKMEKAVQKPLAAVRFAPSIYYKLEKPEK